MLQLRRRLSLSGDPSTGRRHQAQCQQPLDPPTTTASHRTVTLAPAPAAAPLPSTAIISHGTSSTRSMRNSGFGSRPLGCWQFCPLLALPAPQRPAAWGNVWRQIGTARANCRCGIPCGWMNIRSASPRFIGLINRLSLVTIAWRNVPIAKATIKGTEVYVCGDYLSNNITPFVMAECESVMQSWFADCVRDCWRWTQVNPM